MNLELQEVPADTYANERSREDQAIIRQKRKSRAVDWMPISKKLPVPERDRELS